MERTIKLHTEPVNGHAIHSIPPLSWRNHLLTSLKVRNPRPLPKRLPRGGLFVLNDPITLSPIPSLSEWTYPGASRSRLIRSSIPVSISLVTSTSASWNTSLLAWSTNRPPVLISLV